MAVTIYYEEDVDPKVIQGMKVAIIGYGSQGHAHALNLKDSGVDVRVGLREGSKNWAVAEEAGLKVTTMDQAAEEADFIMILVTATSRLPKALTLLCVLLRVLATSFAVSSLRAPVCLIWLAYTRMQPVTLGTSSCPTAGVLAVLVPASSRQPSLRKPRKTSLASRQFFAAAS